MLKFIHLFFSSSVSTKATLFVFSRPIVFRMRKAEICCNGKLITSNGRENRENRMAGRKEKQCIRSGVDSFSQWIFCFRGLTTVSSADYSGSWRMEELRWWMGLSREAKSEKSLVEFHSSHPFNHSSSPSIIVFCDSVINNLPFCVYVSQSVNNLVYTC